MKQFSKYLALVLMSMVLFSSCGKKDEPKKPEPTPAPQEDLSKFNALAFVAEYDVNKAGTGFITSHKLSTSNKYAEWQDSDAGLFTWDEARLLFLDKKFLKDYVLPSEEQWLSIIKKDKIFFDKERSKVSVEEKDVVIGNEPKQTYQSEFITKKEGDKYVTFALRFKGTKWESAWCYFFVSEGKGARILSLGGLKDSGKTLEEIANLAFFEHNLKKLVGRFFPLYGFRKDKSSHVYGIGRYGGYYWSSTSYGGNWARYILGSSSYLSFTASKQSQCYAVRPFHKELPKK